MRLTKAILKSILSPLLSISILMFGNSFFLTFLSVRMGLEGYESTAIGFVHTAFYVGLFAGAAKAEPLIHRIGHIRAFSLAASSMAASFLVQGFFLVPAVWVAMRLLAGLCSAVLYISIESWLIGKSTAATRGSILALYMIGYYLTQGFAQFLIDDISIQSFEPFGLATLFCCLAVIPVAITRYNAPELERPTQRTLWSLFSASPFGFSGCLLSGVVVTIIYTFLPLYAISQNLSVSYAMSSALFGGFLLQGPVGHLSDIFDRGKTLLLVSVTSTLVGTTLFMVPMSPGLTYLSFFILGGLAFTIYPLAIAQVCDRVQPHEYTGVTGMLLVAYGIGSIIGPSTAPIVISQLGEAALPFYIACLTGLLTIIGVKTTILLPSVPAKDQVDFVVLPRSSSVSYELDPRNSTEDFEKTLEDIAPNKDGSI